MGDREGRPYGCIYIDKNRRASSFDRLPNACRPSAQRLHRQYILLRDESQHRKIATSLRDDRLLYGCTVLDKLEFDGVLCTMLSSRARRSRVEGSSHLVVICSQIGAKILRLAALAQDDNGSVICTPNSNLPVGWVRGDGKMSPLRGSTLPEGEGKPLPPPCGGTLPKGEGNLSRPRPGHPPQRGGQPLQPPTGAPSPKGRANLSRPLAGAPSPKGRAFLAHTATYGIVLRSGGQNRGNLPEEKPGKSQERLAIEIKMW